MKLNEITELYNSHPLLQSLTGTINNDDKRKILIEGLSGSSKAIVLSVIFRKTQTTHVAILPEKEDAAYFYNDLVHRQEKIRFSSSPQHINAPFSMSRPNLQILSSALKCLTILLQEKGKG